jgi:hypothetical protein
MVPFGQTSKLSRACRNLRSASSKPDSGWSVLYEQAVSRWLKTDKPEAWLVQMVDEWIARRRTYGPPEDAPSVWGDPQELYAARIERTTLTVTYLVIVHDARAAEPIVKPWQFRRRSSSVPLTVFCRSCKSRGR